MYNKKILTVLILVIAVFGFVFSFPIGGLQNRVFNNSSASSDKLNVISDSANFTSGTYKLPGLIDPVTITIDKSGTAHIFANNNHDLFFAQGYYTATQRLFQMELEALSVSGNFSNYIGAAGVSSDISARLQQIPERAYQLDQTYKSDYPVYYSYLKDYANGVNAYINETVNNPPLGFKLYGFEPVQWKVLYTLDWQENMAFGLINGKGNSIRNDLFIDQFGVSNTSLLWPDYPYFTNNITVVPGNGTVNGYNLTDQGISPNYLFSQNWYAQWATGVNLSVIKNITGILNEANSNDPYLNLFEHNIDRSYAGSNEWIVTANDSGTSKAMIENDPHLGLSLPTLFLPMQLVDPQFNVTGWELVNIPGILIGHTKYTSWGLTTPGGYNANEYLEILNGSKYLYNGTWYPIEVTSYKLLGQTYYVNYTNNGPLWAQSDHYGISFNWAGDNNSLDFIALYKLDQSYNYQSMLNALKYWSSPPQNFALVSMNSSGIITAGKFPLINETLPDSKNVKVIGSQSLLNGSLPSYEPDGFVPFEYLPQTKNPSRGYAYAPNQPLAGFDYPYPLVAESGGQGGRAHTINNYLATHPDITVQEMIDLQANVTAPFAVMLVPLFLKELNSTVGTMNTTEIDSYNYMKNWNYTDYTNEVGPTVYWYLKMEVDNLGFQQVYNKNTFTAEGIPDVTTLIYLAEHDPNSSWFNGNFSILVQKGFKLAVAFLENNIGPNVANWTWGKVHDIEFPNLFGIPSGNYGPIPFKGGSHTVSVAGVSSIDFSVPMSPATTSSVVKEISSPGTQQFYGVFPGGPSENLTSYYYDNQLSYWLTDRYYNMSDQPTVFTMLYEPENFSLTFVESGLPVGTPWAVDLDNISISSVTSSIGFSQPNGTYFYYIPLTEGYSVTNGSGSVILNGKDISIKVDFTKDKYSVSFKIMGAGVNPSWKIDVENETANINVGPFLSSKLVTVMKENLSGDTETIYLPTGVYNFSVSVNGHYTPSYSNFSLDLTSNQTMTLYFTNDSQLYVKNYTTLFEVTTGIFVVIGIAEAGYIILNRKRNK